MTAEQHPPILEVLVEEQSAEVALKILLPKIAPGVEANIRTFQGKQAMLRKLPGRFAGYKQQVKYSNVKIVVLVDRDSDDCHELKTRLETLAAESGLVTLTTATARRDAILANRIAIEELEAWFFGDVAALRKAYPRVPETLGDREGFRDPDAIVNTWERLEQVLQTEGYHGAGLAKLRLASDVAPFMDVELNSSESFQHFRDGLERLLGVGR